MDKILENSISVIAIVVGVVMIASMIFFLISNNKLNLKTSKFTIESAKRDVKSLISECRLSAHLIIKEFCQKYINQFPDQKYQILYISELVMNRIEEMLNYNNISLDEDYINMRFLDICSIINSHPIFKGKYDDKFYMELRTAFMKIIKQIVLLKKHYKEQ